MQIGYWGIKGVAEKARLLAAYLHQEYEEYNPASMEEWQGRKFTLGLEFPNLPYLIDGDVKLTESKALAYYLVYKHKKEELLGNDTLEKAQVQLLIGVLDDINTAVGAVGKDADPEAALLKQNESVLRPKLGYLEKFLGEKEFLVGHLTLADFFFYTVVLYIDVLHKSLEKDSVLNEFPLLRKWEQKFIAIPEIHDYLQTDKGKRPFLPEYFLPKPKAQ